MAKQGQADKIEALDVDLLRTSSAIENSRLLCPRDQVKLVRFVDPFFPEEIIIERCPICEGFWLNRGEFSKYQRFRQEKMNQTEKTPVDIKLEQDIEHILLEYKNGDSTAVLGKLGKFLSIPLDSTNWRPLEPEKLGEKEENALNLILNVLSIILRTFIKI